MPGSSILAVLNRVETAQAILLATGAMAKIYNGAPVDLLFPRPDIDPDFMPTEEVMSPDRRARFQATQQELMTRLAEAAATVGSLPPPREIRGKVRDIVAGQAAQAQLVLAGVPGNHGQSPARDAIEAVLFDARAPLLLLPERMQEPLARVVAVAWERSRAADEVVQAALPLLLAAKRVIILIAEEGQLRADLPESLMETLRRSRSELDVRKFKLDGRDIGDALLAEAAFERADLLVMGAFTHPRVLEMMFGGATREVLKGAHIPLLLHH